MSETAEIGRRVVVRGPVYYGEQGVVVAPRNKASAATWPVWVLLDSTGRRHGFGTDEVRVAR